MPALRTLSLLLGRLVQFQNDGLRFILLYFSVLFGCREGVDLDGMRGEGELGGAAEGETIKTIRFQPKSR